MNADEPRPQDVKRFLCEYITCGALDVGLLNERLKERGIIAGRATGVKTIGELLEAPLESVTYGAEALGILPGMKGKDAVKLMF